VPHTDSDYLTILSEDEVGGLQLMKDSKWVAVKPNPDALIGNIGDLSQVRLNFYFQFSLISLRFKLELDEVSQVTN
jgi:isopenicillin N synthase-like dioxygenase